MYESMEAAFHIPDATDGTCPSMVTTLLCSENDWWRGRVVQSGSFIAQMQGATVTTDKGNMYSHFFPSK